MDRAGSARVVIADDELPPRPDDLPRPGGWFEVACCAGVLLLLVAGIVVLGVIH